MWKVYLIFLLIVATSFHFYMLDNGVAGVCTRSSGLFRKWDEWRVTKYSAKMLTTYPADSLFFNYYFSYNTAYCFARGRIASESSNSSVHTLSQIYSQKYTISFGFSVWSGRIWLFWGSTTSAEEFFAFIHASASHWFIFGQIMSSPAEPTTASSFQKC